MRSIGSHPIRHTVNKWAKNPKSIEQVEHKNFVESERLDPIRHRSCQQFYP
jgi:hypothetical protein